MMGSGRTCVLGIETYQILSTGAEFLFGCLLELGFMGANVVSDRSTCRTTAWYLSPDFEASSF